MTARAARLRVLFSVVGPFVGLLFVVMLFGVWVPRTFLSEDNFKNVLTRTCGDGLAACGMTIVIVAGGIDLSIGSLMALACIATAIPLSAVWLPQNWPDWLSEAWRPDVPMALAWAVLLGLAAGVLGGLLNGLIVTRLRVVPFVATLGTLLVFRGAALWITHSLPVTNLGGDITRLTSIPPEARWYSFPPGVWVLFAVAVAMHILLTRTAFGRHAVAVGSNATAARYSGLAIRRIQCAVYVWGGAMAGLAGVFQTSRLNTGQPTAAEGAELDIIAAVVIGGGSLMGGEASVLGSLLGTLVIATLRNGCRLAGVPDALQRIVIGAMIIAAVALDQWRRRRVRGAAEAGAS